MFSIYEFGGYRLNFSNRSLSRSNQRIDLPEKALDALYYLVQNSGSLVTTDELTKYLWGDRTINKASVRKLINQIRAALLDDRQNPRYIQTVHSRKGYRFITDVQRLHDANLDIDVSRISDRKKLNYRIRSHIFVPVYLGPDLVREIKSHLRVSKWISYKEFPIEDGRLCVLPNGIGVWDLVSTDSFATLSDMATWRKIRYEEIFSGKYKITRILKQLIGKGAWSQFSIFASVFGKLGYAYSVAIVESPQYKELVQARNALQILSCPKPLERTRNDEDTDKGLINLENRFLESGLDSDDMVQFGLAGADIGFASWEGLAYYSRLTNSLTAEDDIIEYQIAVHSLWWMSKCLADIWRAHPVKAMEQLINYLPEIKRQYLNLRSIDPKESISQRTMTEAVLKMNRLHEIIQETLELYR